MAILSATNNNTNFHKCPRLIRAITIAAALSKTAIPIISINIPSYLSAGVSDLTQYPRGVYSETMIAAIKKRATHRSKIIEGQFKGLQKLIDNEVYCMDIITQSLAIQKSLASLNKLILENHLRTHVTEMMGSDNEKDHEKALEELLNLYELNNIRGKSS